MPISRNLLVFMLLPVFAGCQAYKGSSVDPQGQQTRLQGQLTREGDQLRFKPCEDPRRFLIAEGSTGIDADSRALLADGAGPLFADVRGRLGASAVAGNDGQLTLSRVYRVQHEGPGCDDPNFKRTLLRADGQEPFWSVRISNQGMILSGPDHQPLALPYMEEQLPEGRLNFTSEANGQHLELWVAPQRCVDSMSGAVSHLSAELRLNGKLMRGCASFGGARSD